MAGLSGLPSLPKPVRTSALTLIRLLIGCFLVLAPLAPGYWNLCERVEEADDGVTVSVGWSARPEARPPPPPSCDARRQLSHPGPLPAAPGRSTVRQARRCRRRTRRLIHFNDGDDPDPDEH